MGCIVNKLQAFLVAAFVALGNGLPAAALETQPISVELIGAAASEGNASGASALNLAPCICWRNPKVEPRFALLCIHGLGLYSGAYANFGQRMSNFGGNVYAIDVRGFGSWMNANGHQQMDFDGCLADIKSALQSIHMAHPGLPVFVLGESMGGAIALRAATMFPDLMQGVISAVPAGERFKQRRTDLKVALNALRGFYKSNEKIGKSVVEQAATSDPHNGQPSVYNEELAEQWENDPLNRLDLSPDDLLQFQRFMNDNHDAVKKLTVPVLFVQGLDDDLVRPDGTWELIKECNVHDRSMVALPARHLMFEEAQTAQEEIDKASLHSVLAWIVARLPEHAPVGAVLAQKIDAATADRLTGGKPTVVAFYAKWCDQCGNIAAFIDKASGETGRKAHFVKFDVDDAANEDLIKEFNVGALPMVVFLRPDGTVSSSLMGQTNAAVMAKNLIDLVAAPAVKGKK
jgi:alpha-beta hydrolase superfamily lysophospholipase